MNSKKYYDLAKQSIRFIISAPYKHKECKNCIYYFEKEIKEESICYKFGKNKERIYSENFYSAVHCREMESKCGPEGHYFISKLLK